MKREAGWRKEKRTQRYRKRELPRYSDKERGKHRKRKEEREKGKAVEVLQRGIQENKKIEEEGNRERERYSQRRQQRDG